jgi:hypothetical protein
MTAAVEYRVADGELVMPEPVGLQPKWLSSPASRKALRVGRRGTKTRFAFFAALMGHGPGWEDDTPKFKGVLQGGDVVWIAQNYPNLTTVLWREEIVPRMGHLPWVNLNAQRHDVEIPGVGALLLRSGDREAIDSIRGIGKRLFGVIIDEAAWLDLRGALQDVILPALADNDGWLIVMSTTNAGPDGGYDDTGAPQVPSYFNLICKEIQEGKRSKDWEEFTGTAFDNPTLSPKAINELIAEYPPGSPKLDQEVFAKLLETGVGLALPGISEASHMVPAFQPDPHWRQWLAGDWGYHHPWTLGHYTTDEDGQVYKRESLMGRLQLPEQIDATVRKAGIDPSKFPVYMSPDAWRTRVSSKGKIVGEFMGPTVAEELMRLGWKLIPAADARIAGLNNLRRYVHIPPKQRPEDPDTRPRFLWMETPGNKACLAQIARMPLDPDRPEDALKVDADSAGRGGDDYYDETRYGLMARPLASITLPPEDRDGQSMGYDYAKGQQRERESGDTLMNQLLGTTQTPTAGRFRVPVRRGR